MEIWSVTVIMRHAQQAFRLYYKSDAKAQLAYNRLHERDWSGVHIESDDLGNRVALQLSDMCACALTKIDADIDISAEIGLMQAKAQQRIQNRLNADPTIKRFNNALS